MDTTTTTESAIAEIRAHLGAFSEYGAVEAAENLHTEFPHLHKVAETRGQSARWGSRDWVIYLHGSAFIGVQVYYAATEMQESTFEGVVEEMRAETISAIRWIPKGDDA